MHPVKYLASLSENESVNHLTFSSVGFILTDIKANHQKRFRVSLDWLKEGGGGHRERTTPFAHGQACLKSHPDSQR